MSFLDYLHDGQAVDLEIEAAADNPRIPGAVERVDDAELRLRLHPGGAAHDLLAPGTKALIRGRRKGLQFSLYAEVQEIDRQTDCVSLACLPSRSFLRVDAFMPVKYHRITPEQFETRRNLLVHTGSAERDGMGSPPAPFLPDEMDGATGIPPELAHELQSIHKKLDFIIKALGLQTKSSLFGQPPVEVNISGSGMSFITTEHVGAGALLEIEILLPLYSGTIIGLIAKVVRSDVVGRDEAPQFETGVRFEAINEDDRELIIRYVFKRQRELLRAEE